MALLLRNDELAELVGMPDAIDAVERAYREEAAGQVVLPRRLNLPSARGWLRIGPCILAGSGWMGFKAMNLTRGLGVRYQLHLYRVDDGELVAIMDAQHLTTLRTGATSAVATRRMTGHQKVELALLGAGAEARAQAVALHAVDRVSAIRIYSRTPANRERLAAELASQLGVVVRVARSAEEAVDGTRLVAAAVKSAETVLEGRWLANGSHVNSVGTARPDQREVDVETFRRASLIVVDNREAVFEEAGDAIVARDAIGDIRVLELAAAMRLDQLPRTEHGSVTLFKSVGTAVQDVAVSARAYEIAIERRAGRDLGQFPGLKSS